jgi:uridylate kinase
LLCIFAVVVFNLQNTGNIAKAIVGEKVGTFIGCTRNQNQSAEGALDQEKSLVSSGEGSLPLAGFRID